MKICEADPYYDIYMRTWHRKTGNRCQICVAGAVIAQRLGPKYNETTLSDFSLPIQKRLKAIDALRCGMINDAFLYFYEQRNNWADFAIPSYGLPGWWNVANDLLTHLKEQDI